MARTVKFVHDIADEVHINAINVLGRVDSMSIDQNGIMYRVVYWDDGQRYSQWMYDWELKEDQPMK